MGTTEDVEVIRRGYAAFSAGDMATLTELFADDSARLARARQRVTLGSEARAG